MATVALSEFYKYVRPYAPECPDVVLLEHLAEAAAKFCQETQAWRVPLEAAETEAGEQFYDLDVPAGSTVEAVIELDVEGYSITPALETLEPQAKALDTPGRPTAFAVVNGTQIQFYPIPDAAYTYRGLLAVKPLLTATSVPDFLYQTHGRDIAYGAIGTLKLIPGKLWSDPVMADAYLRLFGKGVSEAKRRLYRNVPLRVRQRPFA